MELVDLIGFLAGLFLMISFLPQVIHTMRTKSADDISLLLLFFTLIAGILYEVYAFMLNLLPVVIMNGIFTILVAWQIILTLKYRQPASLNRNSVAGKMVEE